MALTFAVPDSVLATTLSNYRPTMVDNIFKRVPLYYKLKETGAIKETSGGTNIVVPLMYGKNSTFKTYSGYGIIDTTPQEGITAALYNWKQYGGSISISGKEARQNNSSEAIINLLSKKTQQAEMSALEGLGQLLYASGTTDTGTDPHGIATIVATTGTVGGIAKASYSWWQSQTGTAASFAANGLDTMRTLFNSCSVQDQSDHPNLILTTQTIFEYYEKLLQPQERFTDQKTADGGFENLLFKRVPMVWDSYCTASKMYMLNTKYLELTVHSQANFHTTDFVEPENQDAKVAKMIWMGELTASNCQKQGVMSVTAA